MPLVLLNKMLFQLPSKRPRKIIWVKKKTVLQFKLDEERPRRGARRGGARGRGGRRPAERTEE